MVSVLIIVALVALVYLFYRSKYLQHKVYMLLLIALILFVYISASKVLTDKNIDIATFDGMVTAGKLYFNWLGSVFTNARTLIGNAINMDWAGNSTAV